MFVQHGAQARRQRARSAAHTEELLHEEWIAFAQRENPLGARGRASLYPRADLLAREPRQGYDARFASQLGEQRSHFRSRMAVRLPRRRNEEHALAAELARDEQQKQERGDVCHVQIVEQDQTRRFLRSLAEHAGGLLEERKTLTRVGCAGARCERVAAERTKHLRPWPERRRASGLPRAAPRDRSAVRRRVRCELAHQARLPDAGLAPEDAERAVPLLGSLQRRDERRELALPPE